MENRISSGLFFPQTPQIGGCDYAPPRFAAMGIPVQFGNGKKRQTPREKRELR